MSRSRRVPLLPMLLLAAALPAAADPIAYGSAGAGSDELRAFDLGTNTFLVIGSMGLGDVPVRHLTFAPDGTLYGLDHEQGRLVALDPLTGAATVVGPFEDPDPFEFRGFTADACGRLWATGFTGEPGPEAEHWLVGIDPASGHLERLAGGESYEIYGLAGRGERLWGLTADGLVRIDPHDLSVHAIGGPGLQGTPQGLDFAADGTLWGTLFVPPPPITLPPYAGQHTYTVDLGSGAVEGVGDHVPIPAGSFAIMPPTGQCFGESPLAVPALGPVGVLALALLLACGGLLMIARSRRPVQP